MNKSLNILHIDDDECILELSEIYLKIYSQKNDKNFNYFHLNQPKNLEKVLKEKNIHLIISDFNMPDLNGLEILKLIRNKIKCEIPFILFSNQDPSFIDKIFTGLSFNRCIKKGPSFKDQFLNLMKLVENSVM